MMHLSTSRGIAVCTLYRVLLFIETPTQQKEAIHATVYIHMCIHMYIHTIHKFNVIMHNAWVQPILTCFLLLLYR